MGWIQRGKEGMEERTENETRERLRADSEEGTGWESRGKEKVGQPK